MISEGIILILFKIISGKTLRIFRLIQIDKRSKVRRSKVRRSNLNISQIQWLYYSAKRIWKD
jgi:hypothetical protein